MADVAESGQKAAILDMLAELALDEDDDLEAVKAADQAQAKRTQVASKGLLSSALRRGSLTMFGAATRRGSKDVDPDDGPRSEKFKDGLSLKPTTQPRRGSRFGLPSFRKSTNKTPFGGGLGGSSGSFAGTQRALGKKDVEPALSQRGGGTARASKAGGKSARQSRATQPSGGVVTDEADEPPLSWMAPEELSQGPRILGEIKRGANQRTRI